MNTINKPILTNIAVRDRFEMVRNVSFFFLVLVISPLEYKPLRLWAHVKAPKKLYKPRDYKRQFRAAMKNTV